jgi:hypothetical protein
VEILYPSKSAKVVLSSLITTLPRCRTSHLRLELDPERMSDDERKVAADALRRALGLLEKGGS